MADARSRSWHRGMTLIEVLAALALAAMLMATLLTVASSLRRDQRSRDQDTSAYVGANRRLANLLAYDLTHARTLSVADHQVQLVGYSLLNPDDAAPQHRRTRITYRLIPLPGTEAEAGAALVREQFDLDNTTNRAATLDVIALGVESFAIEPALASPVLEVRVTWAGGRRPALEQTLALGLSQTTHRGEESES